MKKMAPLTLQILHFGDPEAGIPAAGTSPQTSDAVRFSAVLNYLRNDPNLTSVVRANTLTLSSGDNYIPGPFFNASSDPSLNGVGGLGTSTAPVLGRGDIAIVNNLGTQASVLGNHEFDLGTRQIRDIIRTGAGNPGTNFPYLSTNVNFNDPLTELAAGTGGTLTNRDAANTLPGDPSIPANKASGNAISNSAEASTIKGKIAKSTFITVAGADGVLGTADDEKVGIVGVTTPTLPTLAPTGAAVTTPTNPVDFVALAAEVQASVDYLISENPGLDKVIVLAHLQQIALEIDELAPRLRNVDVIIAGGSNTRLLDDNDVLRPGDTDQGDYPTVRTGADGKPVLIVNTDGNYKYVGRLVVGFDANGDIDLTSLDTTVNGAYATDTPGVERFYGAGADPVTAAVTGVVDLANDPNHQNIVAITTGIRNVIQGQDTLTFGRTSVFLNGTRSEVRTQETNLGNLTADANIALAKNVDPFINNLPIISLKNGGGIRDNIGSISAAAGATSSSDVTRLPPQPSELAPNKTGGAVSQLDIANSLRFNNNLTTITITVAQLKILLERGVAGVAPGATPGFFPQVGGFSFSFDPTGTAQVLDTAGNVTTAGTRVKNVALLSDDDDDDLVSEVLIRDGVVVGNSDRLLRLVTLDFLANGGDGYPFPKFIQDNAAFVNRVNLVGEIQDRIILNVGNFTIGFSGARVGGSRSGFFVQTTVDDDGLQGAILFDISNPTVLENPTATTLRIGGANLLISEELSRVLTGGVTIAGVDIGDAQIDANIQAIGGTTNVEVIGGITSVALDPAVLALVNLSVAGASNTVAAATGVGKTTDVAVGFTIVNNAGTNLVLNGATPVSGQIDHTGIVDLQRDLIAREFNGRANFARPGSEQDALAEFLSTRFGATTPFGKLTTLGDFTIGFDATRVGGSRSGFFVSTNIDDDGLAGVVVFDISAPQNVSSPTATTLVIGGADLLISQELAGFLGNGALAGTDIGAAQINANIRVTGTNAEVIGGVTTVALNPTILSAVNLEVAAAVSVVNAAMGVGTTEESVRVGFTISNTSTNLVLNGTTPVSGKIDHKGSVSLRGRGSDGDDDDIFDDDDKEARQDRRIQNLGVRRTDTVTQKSRLFLENNTLFSNGTERLKFSLTGGALNEVFEVGVYSVGKDASDNTPEKILERGQVVFTTLSNSPRGFNANSLSRTITGLDGSDLRFFLVKGGTVDAVRRGSTSAEVLLGTNAAQIGSLGNDFSVSFRSVTTSTTFESVTLKVEADNSSSRPLGTRLQGQSQRELLDLREVVGQTVLAEISIFREASFNNTVGFYRIDTERGEIAGINPAVAGFDRNAYIREALSDARLVTSFGSTKNQQTETFSAILQGGSILAPFLISNGTIEDVKAGRTDSIFFPVLGLNPSGADHFRLLGDNTFGIEDTRGGGDLDYNDIILSARLSV
ncbi:MAG: DUF4114 domain-containing protein [Oscillatoriales cyanobacterium SM2_2_1]|nr:DUF4114 domain-containing protein [Oscillatoriales cyanobacterium SM2_2_1]